MEHRGITGPGVLFNELWTVISGMNIAIRYQSRSGNTKAVAEVLADAAGVKSAPIEVALEAPVDLLFVGGGVYGWDVDPLLKDFLETLDSQRIKSVAAFSTAGGMNGAQKIAAIVKSKGIHVHEEALSLKLGVRNHALFGGKGNVALTDKQVLLIRNFANKIMK